MDTRAIRRYNRISVSMISMDRWNTNRRSTIRLEISWRGSNTSKYLSHVVHVKVEAVKIVRRWKTLEDKFQPFQWTVGNSANSPEIKSSVIDGGKLSD